MLSQLKAVLRKRLDAKTAKEVTGSDIMNADKRGIDAVMYPAPGIQDAFSRLRVADITTLFDSKQVHDKQPLFWDESQVSGSSTLTSYDSDRASTTMTVSSLTAGKRVRQTFQRFNYQPGKSHLILMTARMGSGATNTGITAEVGYHDDDNGVFFRLKDGVIYTVVKSSVTGTAVDTAVAQADWNVDTMDGNGPSGIAIDPSKSQIMLIDFEWLGVGIVRYGFVVDGQIIYCHVAYHANNIQAVYMSTPNLPLRYSIENDGTAESASIECICGSVASEGGSENNGVLFYEDSGSISTLNSGTTYAAIGIRLQSGYLGLNTLIEAISLIVTSGNDNCAWDLRFNPTVAGTFTYNDVTNSGVQIATGSNSNTVTGGQRVTGGFFSSALPAGANISNARRLGADISGTVDEVVLCVSPITNNITIQAGMTWRELS